MSLNKRNNLRKKNNVCWAVYHGEWPSKMSVQEMLNESATAYYDNCDKISTTEPFDNERACNETAPGRHQREAQGPASR